MCNGRFSAIRGSSVTGAQISLRIQPEESLDVSFYYIFDSHELLGLELESRQELETTFRIHLDFDRSGGLDRGSRRTHDIHPHWLNL